MITASSASVVESIHFTRRRTRCEQGAEHPCYHYEIEWATPRGEMWARGVQRCWHPVCDTTPWRLLHPERVDVLLSAQIPEPGRAVAFAYILRLYLPHDCAPFVPMTVARIGICDQWEDRQLGNNRGQLFSRRYFAADGPGVYPATIHKDD